MSGGSIRRELAASLARHAVPPLIEDATRSIDALPAAFLDAIYAAGVDAALSEADNVLRGSAIALEYAAVQLADDLSDGDNPWVQSLGGRAPALLVMLCHLALERMFGLLLPHETLRRISGRLLSVGRSQYALLTARERWSADDAWRCAATLNGDQFAAYLMLLWSGTPLEESATTVGGSLGTLIHLVTDIHSGDPRFWSLPARERSLLLARAGGLARSLRRCGIPSARHTAIAAQSVLDACPPRRPRVRARRAHRPGSTR